MDYAQAKGEIIWPVILPEVAAEQGARQNKHLSKMGGMIGVMLAKSWRSNNKALDILILRSCFRTYFAKFVEMQFYLPAFMKY